MSAPKSKGGGKRGKGVPSTVRLRQSLRDVQTVPSLEAGRAACADPKARKVFDQAQFGSGSYRAQADAAFICTTCPLRLTCGFRIKPPPNSQSRAK